MKRTPIAELLDTDAGTAAEVRASLSDLRLINRYFGGVSTTQQLIKRVSQRRPSPVFTLLEVASGSGFVPNQVKQRVQKQRLDLQVTLLDRVASHFNGERGVAADALALPFPDNSFDLVSCNLFAHHLEPPGVVHFVNESLRVCRTAVLINDLIRNSLHLALVWTGLPLFRSRLTRHDAPASVLQSYTMLEMRRMLNQTNAARVEIKPYYLFRQGVIAWKTPSDR